jgi:Fe-S cluster assembly protein SufD
MRPAKKSKLSQDNETLSEYNWLETSDYFVKYYYPKKFLDLFENFRPGLSSRLETPLEPITFPTYLLNNDTQKIIFVDGCYISELSNQNKLPRGVILTSIFEAIQNFPHLIKPYLKNIKRNLNLTPWTNLILDDLQNGIFLYVPEEVIFEKPLYLLFYTTKNHGEVLRNFNNLFVIKSHSKLQLLEEYFGSDVKKYGFNVLNQFYLEEAARVDYYKLQSEGKNAMHLASCIIDQQAGSHVNINSLGLGGLFSSDHINVMLNGAGASCNLQGIGLATASETRGYSTRIEHLAKQSISNELYKSVINDSAKSVFQGRIKIHEKASESVALLKNYNLLLSKRAEVDTLPELEIYAKDVKCNHGATAGRLDQDALFYLRSRGLNPKEAKLLLLKGFLEEIIDKIENPIIVKYFTNRLNDKLQ